MYVFFGSRMVHLWGLGGLMFVTHSGLSRALLSKTARHRAEPANQSWDSATYVRKFRRQDASAISVNSSPPGRRSQAWVKRLGGPSQPYSSSSLKSSSRDTGFSVT